MGRVSAATVARGREWGGWLKASPWIISTTLHLAMLALLWSVWAVGRKYVSAEAGPPPIMNPSSFLNPDGGLPGGPLHDGDDPIGDAARNMTKLPADANWQKVYGDAAALARKAGGGSAADALARAAAVAGSGPGTAGGAAAIGTPEAGGLGNGPKVTFFGTAGGGKRIIYILDRSGGMVAEWPGLKSEVARSIGQMVPIQRAAIVLVGVYLGPGTDQYDPPKVIADNGQLMRMTGEGKGLLISGMPEQPDNRNDGELKPFVDSFAAAFAMKPDLIFFLTDGEFDRALLPEVAKMNPDGKVRINTLRFGLPNDGGEATQGLEQALEKLAKDNSGVYRYVPEEESAGGR